MGLDVDHRTGCRETSLGDLSIVRRVTLDVEKVAAILVIQRQQGGSGRAALDDALGGIECCNGRSALAIREPERNEFVGMVRRE